MFCCSSGLSPNDSDNSNNGKNSNRDCNLFEMKASDFPAISGEPAANVEGATNDPVDAMPFSILDLDAGSAGGSIRDLILSLGREPRTSNTNTAIGSPLTTAATVRGFFTERCISGASLFSSDDDDDDNDDDDDSGDGNDADNEGDEEPTPSTSENYLDVWTPEYNAPVCLFATLSSGNFLSESEITQIFSRFVAHLGKKILKYGNVEEVKWTRIDDNNGYIIVFSNEIEKQNAIKICGNKMETKGRVLKLWSFKQAQLFLNSRLSVVDATNCSLRKSAEESNHNNPCIVDEKLLGPADQFESNDSNDINNYQNWYRNQNTSAMTLNENMPSPERPGTRPSPATAFLLKQISEANVPETNQFCERIPRESATEKNRFLNLPAPYHLLPDTPYFRRAPIVPPPTRSLSATEQLPIHQRIINRYLASMKIDDENGFAAIAQYERQCSERLYGSANYPSTSLLEQQKQRRGCTGEGGGLRREEGGEAGTEFGTGTETEITRGEHALSTDFFAPTRIEDQTRICATLESNNNNSNSNNNNNNDNDNNNCVSLLPPGGQQYEIWNCPATWTWNYCNFKE